MNSLIPFLKLTEQGKQVPACCDSLFHRREHFITEKWFLFSVFFMKTDAKISLRCRAEEEVLLTWGAGMHIKLPIKL